MNSEIILKIEEFFNYEFDYRSMSGYKVTTNKQEILVLISDQQSCCENFGFMISEDDPSEFIGAELRHLSFGDRSLTPDRLRNEYSNISEQACLFVNLETSKGLFQITVYNEHNGYYGHGVLVKSNHLNLEECI